MAVAEINDERREDGAALLEALRASGVDIMASFWSYTSELGEWRLIIVSLQVETRGPKELLRRTHKALQDMQGGACFTFFDVSFGAPISPAIRSLVANLPFLNAKHSVFPGIRVDDKILESVYVHDFDFPRILLAGDADGHLAAE